MVGAAEVEKEVRHVLVGIFDPVAKYLCVHLYVSR